jgi:hypothetical protein
MAKKRVKATSSTSSNLHIPKDEQWRLINESGILKTASETAMSKLPAQTSKIVSLVEELADAFLYITPFSFLLLMMEMYIYLSICVISLTLCL